MNTNEVVIINKKIKKSWVCRDYKNGDEYQILDLFEKVFKKKLNLDYWKWRFIENPFENGIIKLLFNGKELIGHYAVLPTRMEIQNKLVKCVFSMTTMTHPNYMGQGIFTYLAKETYKECKQKGFKFVYGFPNEHSYYGFIKKLDWKDLGKVSFLCKNIEKENITEIGDVYKLKKFNIDVNLLWEKVKNNYQVIVPRIETFLNWRFVKNPDVDYIKYAIKNHENELLGYIVLKIYIKQNEVKGHIVDILCINNQNVVKKLLLSAYNYFIKNGIKNISCWMQNNHFYNIILKEEGFIRNDTETYFGVSIFDKEYDLLRSIECADNWYLTMGNSDVF